MRQRRARKENDGSCGQALLPLHAPDALPPPEPAVSARGGGKPAVDAARLLFACGGLLLRWAECASAVRGRSRPGNYARRSHSSTRSCRSITRHVGRLFKRFPPDSRCFTSPLAWVSYKHGRGRCLGLLRRISRHRRRAGSSKRRRMTEPAQATAPAALGGGKRMQRPPTPVPRSQELIFAVQGSGPRSAGRVCGGAFQPRDGRNPAERSRPPAFRRKA